MIIFRCHSPLFLETDTDRKKSKNLPKSGRGMTTEIQRNKGRQRRSKPKEERTKQRGNVRRGCGWDQVNRNEQNTSCRWKTSRSWWDVEVRMENDKELSQTDSAPPPYPNPLHSLFSFLSVASVMSFSPPHGLRLRWMCSALTEALRHLPQGLPTELQPLPYSNKASWSLLCSPCLFIMQYCQ